MENKDISDYYDNYVDHQDQVGINERHFSILNKSIQHGLKRTDNVLEVGCGIGTFTKLLSQYITKGTVFAIDISEKSIELAKRRFQNRKHVSFKTLNLVTETIDQQFNVIILPDVIEHIPLEFHKIFFSKLNELLHENGQIFIHIPNPYYLYWCSVNKPEVLQIIDQPVYTPVLIDNIRELDLHIHFLETYSIWVHDGDYQFIALKKNGFQKFENKSNRSLKTAVYLKLRKLLNVDK